MQVSGQQLNDNDIHERMDRKEEEMDVHSEIMTRRRMERASDL